MSNTHLDTARIFLALWPTSPERRALAAWQERLKDMGRVMRPATLHATLIFLGEIEVARLEVLLLAAGEVAAKSFELCFDEARYWGHNHIVYAAPSNIPHVLLQLVFGLEQSLIRHGFKFDHREYKPHVTLLRNVHWTDDPLPEMKPVCWKIKDFVLVRGGGMDYRVLAHFPLS